MTEHHHIIPTGQPPDAIGWQSARTARKWGIELYGPNGYRLLKCTDGGCAVYPPTPSPGVPALVERNR